MKCSNRRASSLSQLVNISSDMFSRPVHRDTPAETTFSVGEMPHGTAEYPPIQTILMVAARDDTHHPLELALVQAGYQVDIATGNNCGYEVMVSRRPSVVIICATVEPGELTHLRQLTDAPIIAFLHHPTQEQVLEALDGGVDDCQTDAIGIPEQVSRVRALLRRAPPHWDHVC